MAETTPLVVTTAEALREMIRAEVCAALAPLRREIAAVTMAPRPEWVPIAEFATTMKRSTKTVRRMIDRGEVDSKRIGSATLVKVR